MTTSSDQNRRLRETSPRRRTEAEWRAVRSEFLNAIKRELSSSLDYRHTLTRIARLAVSTIADWCIVDMVDDAGVLRRLAVTHNDPTKAATADEYARRYPPTAEIETAAARVAKSGEPERVRSITDTRLVSMARDTEHFELLRELGLASYTAVPLKAQERTIGVLSCIVADSAHGYGEQDLVVLEILALYAGQAIDNARLFEDLKQQAELSQRREARVARISHLYELQAETIQAVIRARDQTGLFEAVCRTLVDNGGFRMAWVALLDSNTHRFHPEARYGTDADGYLASLDLATDSDKAALRPTPRAVATGEAATCNDIAQAISFQPWRDRALAYGYRASAALPLRIGNQVIGALNIYAGETGFFDAEGVRLFTEIGEDISFVLTAMHGEQGRYRTENELQAQRAFATIVLDNLKDGVVACDSRGKITLFNGAAQKFHGRPIKAPPPKNWHDHFQLFESDGETPVVKAGAPLDQVLAGEAIQDVEIVIVPDRGEQCVIVCNGQLLYDGSGQKTGAVVTMHDVTQRKQAETRLVGLAFYDPLTDLPNRRLLMDRLNHALARGERQPASVAVLFIDLDRLKALNDNLGHEIGDEVLVVVAQRLREAVRSGDTVARLGGDEFVVVCEDLAGAEEATALSHRIAHAIAAPCLLEHAGAEVTLTASIGIALSHGSENGENLLRNADIAMYRAKRSGKARHVLFDDALRTQAVKRLSVENELRQAIENDQLRLLYQPIIDLTTERIIGAEALVRYYDPERGMIMPDEFIEIAEESGLIIPMGNWVLEKACGQVRGWRKIAPDFEMSINVSTRQIGDPQFTHVFHSVLRNNDLPSGAIALEITESVLMEAANSAKRVLQELKDAGPRLGIDDFGTGYSSLTYLRHFPIDFIKIDQSFVSGLGRDQDDTAIVTAVNNLGKALQLTTIGEGVETAAQCALLRELGCDRAQGFYFAKPQPSDVIDEWLRHPPVWSSI